MKQRLGTHFHFKQAGPQKPKYLILKKYIRVKIIDQFKFFIENCKLSDVECKHIRTTSGPLYKLATAFFFYFFKSDLKLRFRLFLLSSKYSTIATISRGLYIFYPIFHCGLYRRVVYNEEQLICHDSLFATKNRTDTASLSLFYIRHCGL